MIGKISNWLVFSKLLSWPRKLIGQLLNQLKICFILYNHSEKAKVIDLINQTKNESDMLLTNFEAYQIFVTVKNLKKITGDIAEVGVYNGGSAKLICEAKGTKKLFLFDTFEGLPDIDQIDKSDWKKGQFASNIVRVKNYLAEYNNVFFYKGLFPSTAKPLVKHIFSFVHLDVDIYKSTLDCLDFFYPRMSKGGIIISHDYYSKSIRKAIEDFFKNKPEAIIELPGSQCLISKL